MEAYGHGLFAMSWATDHAIGRTQVYTHVYKHVYTQVYTHVYTHVYMQVYTHVYTHVYTQVAPRLNWETLAIARERAEGARRKMGKK